MHRPTCFLKYCIGIILCCTGQIVYSTSKTSISDVTMCLYDPVGTNGPLYQALQDYRLAALDWGVKLHFKTYTDERVAADEFKAEVCDLVNLSGIRARSFNAFTGTINALGAIPTYEHLELILSTLASDKATPLMRVGKYEIMSIIPIGAVFPMVADRSINAPEKLAGRKIGVLETAPEMQYLVKQVGLIPVNVTVSNVFTKSLVCQSRYLSKKVSLQYTNPICFIKMHGYSCICLVQVDKK